MKAPVHSPVTRLAQSSLQRAGKDLTLAQSERNRVVREAREVGLSHQQIGDELGISEAAVRGILRRNPRTDS